MVRIRFGVILNTVRLYDNAHYYLRHRTIFNAKNYDVHLFAIRLFLSISLSRLLRLAPFGPESKM